MKKILFAFVIFSQVLSEKIVAQNYVPFPDSLGKWNESSSMCGTGGPGFSCCTDGYLYCQSIDTIISGNEYSLIGFNHTYFQCEHNGTTTSVHNYSFTPPGFIFGAIREDSSRHVWFRRLNDSSGIFSFLLDSVPLDQIFPLDSDIILYDFNLNAGDTVSWKPFSNIVSAVDSIQLLNGEWRRRITFNNYYSDYWIEGIGSDLGLFGSYQLAHWYFNYCKLNCFRIGNTLLYDTYSLSINCDQPYLGMDDLKPETDFSLFPNPAANSVNLFSNQKKDSEFSIINTLGQTMKEISLPAGSRRETFSLENIPSGIYFCVLRTEDGKIAQQKLVVEK